MSKKGFLGYALTAVVVFWGFFWVPIHGITAVKPYTANPLRALGYTPIVIFLAIPVFTLFIRLLESANPREKRLFGIKGGLIFSVWLIALCSFPIVADARNRFLRKQIIWQGTCRITQVWATQQEAVVAGLKCANGSASETYDVSLINALISGKDVTCKTNANGTADCQ